MFAEQLFCRTPFPVQCFYNELVTDVYYIKKREKKSLIDGHGFQSTWELLIQSSGKISTNNCS